MMTELKVRNEVVNDIEQAVKAGARQQAACEVMGVAVTTLRRWKPVNAKEMLADRRPDAIRPTPANRLSEAERQQIVNVCNQPDYRDLPPSQIVPRLADKGDYIASESSFYRELKAQGQLHHRGRAKATQRRRLTTHVATKPNDVWMWDITYLPTTTTGQHYYLYMIEDLYSRFAVHWEVHDCERGELAATLVEQAVLKRCLEDKRPVLHSDNGSPMKAYTMRAKLDALGIKSSYSRPRVSNDNPYIESMFRTVKYCPQWPSTGFESLEAARAWVATFVRWYNEDHRHSGIKFVTPGQRYRHEDQAILKAREGVYQAAKERHPTRWSANTRNWDHVTEVLLNPEKKITLAA